MSNVIAHKTTKNIQRFSTDVLPVQIAAHEVKGVPGDRYCAEHVHHDCYEINLVLPSAEGLLYQISANGTHHLVDYPAAVWLPPGVLHSANALEGTGWFVCLRFPTVEDPFK